MEYLSIQKIAILSIILSCFTPANETARYSAPITKSIKSVKFLVRNTDNNLATRLILYNSTLENGRSTDVTNGTYTPVLFWHGMGDTAYGSININRLAIQKLLQGVAVFSVQVGDNVFEDELGGFFANVNHQVDQVCRQILDNSIIKEHGSFNCIGFSQGAQFLRALIQRCPFEENHIRVKNFISLGGQHQGVFGLPRCNQKLICDHIRYLLSYGAYEPEVQEHVVQAEYWHDSHREEEYKRKNIFLADINNELHLNETYRHNLLQLDNMVLVKFLNDSMVTPPESSLFGFYKPGSTSDIVPLIESSIYTENRLGLKNLMDSKKLHFIELEGDHLEYSMKWFNEDIVMSYLKN